MKAAPAQKAILDKHSADLKRDLTKALKAEYVRISRQLSVRNEKDPNKYMRISLGRVVEQEINEYFEKVGVTCRISQDNSGSVSVSEPEAKSSLDDVARKLLGTCREVFSNLNDIRYNDPKWSDKINKCMPGLLLGVSKVVTGSMLFAPAFNAIALSGATLAVGTFALPTVGVAVVGAAAIAFGGMTIMHMMHIVMSPSHEYGHVREASPLSIPSHLSIIATTGLEALHGISGSDVQQIQEISDKSAKKIADAIVESLEKSAKEQEKGAGL